MPRVFTLIKRRKEGKKEDKHWIYELKWYDPKAPKHIQSLESIEHPHPEFEAVMQAMAPYACTALDLPADYDEGMEIRQIKFEEEGIRIGTVKELTSGDVVSLPMPLIPTGSVQGSPELAAMRKQANRYVDGIRAQLDLFVTVERVEEATS